MSDILGNLEKKLDAEKAERDRLYVKECETRRKLDAAKAAKSKLESSTTHYDTVFGLMRHTYNNEGRTGSHLESRLFSTPDLAVLFLQSRCGVVQNTGMGDGDKWLAIGDNGHYDFFDVVPIDVIGGKK